MAPNSSKDEYPMKQFPSKRAGWKQHSAEPSSEGNRYDEDEAHLARFGRRQQLRRNFNLISIIGLTCTLMITWEGYLSTFQSGLANGGPAGLVYGYLFSWVGSMIQTLVMAEMASMIPLAGGQFNWVAELSPPSCSKFLSYLTGWVTFISWQAGLASAAFIGGTQIQGLLVLNNPNYDYQRWQGTLLYCAIIGFGVIFNTVLARLLPKVEGAVLIVHVVGFFCILIPLAYLGPHNSAAEVFATFTNSGGWSSTGLSFFVGLPTSMFTFIGYDAASHMAEEIETASIVIPRSMIVSVGFNGLSGFAMVMVTLFSLGDPNVVLNTPTQFPYMQIFLDSVGSTGGASAMAAICVASQVFATIGFLATASRMMWAFARDRGLPFSDHLAKVDPKSALPLYSIAATAVISCVLALINIGSSTAFRAFTTLVVSSFFSVYALAAGLLLYKRLTTPLEKIPFGQFHLGRAGTPLILISLAYSFIGSFFSFWPAQIPVDASSMNWSIVVYAGAMLVSIIFWFAHGRKYYRGPVLEVESAHSVEFWSNSTGLMGGLANHKRSS